MAAPPASLVEVRSPEEMNSCAKAIWVELGRFGAVTTAGNGVLAAQQSVWAVLCADGGAQQLCAPMCVRCRQVPSGAISATIIPRATVARWNEPCSMVPAYHESRILP